MEELTTAVQQNALHAHEASKLASNASDMSDDGRRLVEGMLVSMSDISAGSNQIADITSIIEGIAFQTNILALNAAVEAAGAGEEGRGFAVVAAEVRNLAQRSSAAAREIKDLIEASTTHVSVGSGQAADVQLATHKAREAVLHVCKLIDEISVASDEQGRGIEQINTAVGQMDQMTQQNAALVEEAAGAAQSLEAQAARLDAMTARFTVPVAA
jgi:methyl-accepting chemotaxis protein